MNLILDSNALRHLAIPVIVLSAVAPTRV